MSFPSARRLALLTTTSLALLAAPTGAHATDLTLGSGVTAIIFDQPAIASGTVLGGAPGGRDTALLDPSMTARVLERLRHPAETEDPRYAALTDQERRILAEIAEGKTNRQIAQSLYLAEKTVKNYVSSLLRKLNVERRTEAAVFAIEHEKRQRRG